MGKARGSADDHSEKAANRRLPLYSVRDLPVAADLNARLCATFAGLSGSPEMHRSHFFHGRFENLYLPLDAIPRLREVLAFAEEAAREFLGQPRICLRTGFWFNRMQPGDVTSRHTHDEDDELASAVYYLKAPADSGDLVLHAPEGAVCVSPRAGRLVLFPPWLAHEVGPNRSGEVRLSVGMNFGHAAG